MAITSVTIGGLNVNDGASYAISADTVPQLYARCPHDSVSVDRARQTPVHIRSQPLARSLTMGVFFLRTLSTDRKADYDTLVAAVGNPSGSGLIPLVWTDGAATYTFMVHRQTLTPARWFAKADLELTSYDLTATVT